MGIKRALKPIIPILAMSLVLCSCSKSAQKSIRDYADEEDLPTLSIAARSGSYTDVISSVLAQFEEDNNCKVFITSFDSDELHDEILENSQKETGFYDVIMIDDPLMPEYIENGVLCNLTKLGYIDDEDFVEKSRLLGKDPYPLGATYALPFSGNVQLIFYNEDIIGSNPDFSSWDNVLEYCQKANEAGKKGYAIRGQTGNPIVSDFLPILWAFGADIFDDYDNVILDSKESREALSFYCKLYETGECYNKDSLVEAISSGEAAIGLGWPSWFISGTGSKAAISQIPSKKDSSTEAFATGEIGNWLLGVSDNSTNKELALELVRYLTSADVQKRTLSYGGIPTRKSVFRDQDILTQYPFFETIYNGTNNSRVRPRTTKWSQIEDVFGAELMKCINNEQSIDATITNSHKAIKELVKE
ncbi:extracellular solute-binding protein [Butyrivibrio proteoclasticus]|uniref:extracellular solute-binding protein n=1 Tax=Butyrivibrio proteoclasticus TaxID=43305 RepID=UPI00047CB07C|nr:extracellular solute-binding protein [Butyrivibrio proteoclasticus]